MSKIQFTTDDSKKVLTITRTFNAPRDRVWHAFTDAETLKKWWGPNVWPVTVSNMDFREGGKWHYCMSGPDNAKAWGLTKYKEIVTPEKIVYTDHFSNEEGTIDESLPSGTTTILFEANGDQTKIVSITEYPNAEDLEKVTQMGMIEGVTETWDNLEKLLAGNV